MFFKAGRAHYLTSMPATNRNDQLIHKFCGKAEHFLHYLFNTEIIDKMELATYSFPSVSPYSFCFRSHCVNRLKPSVLLLTHSAKLVWFRVVFGWQNVYDIYA